MGINKHFNMGRDSNFPICCIFWFMIRLIFFNVISIISAPKLNSKWQHVACPMHKLLYFNKEVSYSYCDKCDWMQYGNNSCNLCLSSRKRIKWNYHKYKIDMLNKRRIQNG